MPKDYEEHFVALNELIRTKEGLEKKISKALTPKLMEILRRIATEVKSREPHNVEVYVSHGMIRGDAIYRYSDFDKDRAEDESKSLTKKFAIEVHRQFNIPRRYVSAQIREKPYEHVLLMS